MRTRRSPRNQERLWSALGGPPAPQPPPPSSSRRCWNCANYPKGGRSRGHCTLLGVMVQGAASDRECFRGRAAGVEVE